MLMLLIWNCICIYIHTNYVYNYARLYTTYMVYHRLPTIYNVLCSLYYILCIPYHIHYMQHTTHSFLCILISNINHSINYILYIVYHMLCPTTIDPGAREPWDLSDGRARTKAKNPEKKGKPIMLLCSPTCTAFF